MSVFLGICGKVCGRNMNRSQNRRRTLWTSRKMWDLSLRRPGRLQGSPLGQARSATATIVAGVPYLTLLKDTRGYPSAPASRSPSG